MLRPSPALTCCVLSLLAGCSLDWKRHEAVDACAPNVCGGCGVIDNADELGDECVSGAGDCAGPGAWICDGADALTCSGTPANPSAERCGGGGGGEDCDGKQTVTFDFDGVGSTHNQGCDTKALGWNIVITNDQCYDYATGYSDACGKQAMAVQSGYRSDGSKLSCSTSSASTVICGNGYFTTVRCR